MLEQYRHLCAPPTNFTRIVFEAITLFQYYNRSL